MKDWFGILIFVAIAIANIMLEQKRQKKKKAARTASPASIIPPSRKRAPVKPRIQQDNDQPVEKEPTLQEALQSLFENSRMEPRKEVPPPLPGQSDAEAPKPLTRVVAPPAKPVLPVSPTPVPPPPAAQPILPPASEKRSAQWLSMSDFRTRASLRRAVIMSEVLAKPRGLQ